MAAQTSAVFAVVIVLLAGVSLSPGNPASSGTAFGRPIAPSVDDVFVL